MIVKVLSGSIIGIDSYPIDVEVDIHPGLPQFSTVGLPDMAIRESKDRTKSAIKNSGYSFPKNRVTVNLAPADTRKEGSGFDLPIAVGILAAEGTVVRDGLRDYMIIGELSLDGRVKGIRGALPAAFQAKKMGLRGIIVPKENAVEAAVAESIDVIAVEYLSDVVEFLNGTGEILPTKINVPELFSGGADYPFDFSEVSGQDQAKRALEVAAAGGHNVLMLYKVYSTSP